MQIAQNLDGIKIDFDVPLPDGSMMPRHTWIYLLLGERITLIDTAVAGSWPKIRSYIENLGRDPGEVDLCILTHSHPDHIGAAPSVAAATGCAIAAHRDAVDWMENPHAQKAERPVPGFDSLIEGRVEVTRHLKDGEVLDLAGVAAVVIHTPGHCAGHITLHLPETNALISGDCILPPGDMPTYSDHGGLIQSMARLATLPDVSILLSALHRAPIAGRCEVAFALAQNIDYLSQLDGEVQKAAEMDPKELTPNVVKALNMPPAYCNPIVQKALSSHICLPAGKSYFLAEIEQVFNHEAYQRYVESVHEIIASYGGRYLSRGQARNLSNDSANSRMILIEFPSQDHIYQWLNSDEYRQLAAIRAGAVRGRAMILDSAEPQYPVTAV